MFFRKKILAVKEKKCSSLLSINSSVNKLDPCWFKC